MEHVDLVIIGGGQAGLAAAYDDASLHEASLIGVAGARVAYPPLLRSPKR